MTCFRISNPRKGTETWDYYFAGYTIAYQVSAYLIPARGLKHQLRIALRLIHYRVSAYLIPARGLKH